MRFNLLYLLIFSHAANAQELNFQRSIADALQFPAEKTAITCELFVNGLYVFTEKNWFLFGKAKCSNTYSRSFLLVTQNFGKTWNEPLLKPKELCAASILTFVSKKIGYLVVSHTEEGAGPEYLYATQNAGLSWKFISEIEKGKTPWRSTIHNFTVTSPQNLCYNTAEVIEIDYVLVQQLCSTNAGKTWSAKIPAKKIADAAFSPDNKLINYYKIQVNNNYSMTISEDFIDISNKKNTVQLSRKIMFEKIAKLNLKK